MAQKETLETVTDGCCANDPPPPFIVLCVQTLSRPPALVVSSHSHQNEQEDFSWKKEVEAVLCA